MKARTSIALAAAALLAGTAAASAAGMQQSNAGDKMAPLASDTLSLSSTPAEGRLEGPLHRFLEPEGAGGI